MLVNSTAPRAGIGTFCSCGADPYRGRLVTGLPFWGWAWLGDESALSAVLLVPEVLTVIIPPGRFDLCQWADDLPGVLLPFLAQGLD